jgi:plastocyanin
MKWLIGFFVLLVALVAVSGCTQQSPAANVTATPEPTTVPTTMQETIASVTGATVIPTTEATTVTTTLPNVTATTSGTPVVTSNATLIPTTAPTVAAASGITTIHITKTGFTPQVDVVLPGTSIAWINDDTVSHTIKAIGDHDGMFNSGEILSKSQFSFDFGAKEGTFDYAFADNKTITGTIIVKSGRTLTS